MAMKIRILSDSSINKIAAGEVIENPASVVKELIENALDADATDIVIEIRAGGRQLIRIADNGIGMTADDAILSLERHATSKIRDAADISDISTMGFRGEAIPSIASISKFVMSTCPRDNNTDATTITVDGGALISCKPAARSPGTTIEIRSLFFNVPVRKKFQKSLSHDISQITSVVSSLALGNPHISFRLLFDDKEALSLKKLHGLSFAESMRSRASDLLGREFSHAAQEVYCSENGITVEGMISPSTHTRPNRTGQHIFINRRPIFSPPISYAVSMGYGTRLNTGRFPLFLLHLTLPSSIVDVNVHPQKREVRFQDEGLIRAIITKAIDKALMKAHQPPHVDSPSVMQAFSPKSLSLLKASDYSPSATFHTSSLLPPQKRDAHNADLDIIILPQVIGILGDYILLNSAALDITNEGLALVDSKGAQFRIIFDALIDKTSSSFFEIQHLLVPISLQFSSAEATILRKNLNDLVNFGIGIREFGGNDFLIDAIPNSLNENDVNSFIADILENLTLTESMKHERRRTMAVAIAHASLPRKNTLTSEAAQGIINMLMKCQDSHHTPQGKTIIAYLPKEELEKKFG